MMAVQWAGVRAAGTWWYYVVRTHTPWCCHSPAAPCSRVMHVSSSLQQLEPPNKAVNSAKPRSPGPDMEGVLVTAAPFIRGASHRPRPASSPRWWSRVRQHTRHVLGLQRHTQGDAGT